MSDPIAEAAARLTGFDYRRKRMRPPADPYAGVSQSCRHLLRSEGGVQLIKIIDQLTSELPWWSFAARRRFAHLRFACSMQARIEVTMSEMSEDPP